MNNKTTRNEAINVLVKKQKNSYITILSNLPQVQINEILNRCRTKFGCGGNVLKESQVPTICLQGNQKFSVEKHKDSIFKGLEVIFNDKNNVF